MYAGKHANVLRKLFYSISKSLVPNLAHSDSILIFKKAIDDLIQSMPQDE